MNDPDLRCRVGDILWLRNRDHVSARLAARAYFESAKTHEDPYNWVFSVDRYDRGIRLARQLGDRTAVNEMLDHLENRVVHYDGQDPLWFSHSCIELLEEFGHGDRRLHALALRKIANRARQTGDYRRARQHFATSGALFRKLSGDADAAEAARAGAQCYVEEAEACEKAGSFLAAHSFWEAAIHAFRAIPEGTNDVPELHRRLESAAKKMQAEMKTISTNVDPEKPIKSTIKMMSGLGRA